jgi:hypothetical protein
MYKKISHYEKIDKFENEDRMRKLTNERFVIHENLPIVFIESNFGAGGLLSSGKKGISPLESASCMQNRSSRIK